MSPQQVGWASAHHPMLPPLAGVSRFWPVDRPIKRIKADRRAPTKAPKRPIGGMRHKSVLHRIEMDGVHVNSVIRVIADRMLPIPALPNAGFALADQGCTPAFRPRDRS